MPAPATLPAEPDAVLNGLAPDQISTVYYVRRFPYATPAQVFLQFAHEDMTNDTPRSRANGLTNAKRAIANRVDALLYCHGLRGFAKRGRWGIPEKIASLRRVGINTPDLVHRLVNRPRNSLEHEYVIPSEAESVMNTIEIAELYLAATDSIAERGQLRAMVFGKIEPPIPAFSLAVPPADHLVLDFDFDVDTVTMHRSGRPRCVVPLRSLAMDIVSSIVGWAVRSGSTGFGALQQLASETEFEALL